MKSGNLSLLSTPILVVLAATLFFACGCTRMLTQDLRNVVESKSEPSNWQKVDLDRFYIDPALARAQKEESDRIHSDGDSKTNDRQSATSANDFEDAKPDSSTHSSNLNNRHSNLNPAKRLDRSVAQDTEHTGYKDYSVKPASFAKSVQPRVFHPIPVEREPARTQIEQSRKIRPLKKSSEPKVITLQAQVDEMERQLLVPPRSTAKLKATDGTTEGPSALVARNPNALPGKLLPRVLVPDQTPRPGQLLPLRDIAPTESKPDAVVANDAPPKPKLPAKALATNESTCPSECECDSCNVKSFENELLAALENRNKPADPAATTNPESKPPTELPNASKAETPKIMTASSSKTAPTESRSETFEPLTESKPAIGETTKPEVADVTGSQSNNPSNEFEVPDSDTITVVKPESSNDFSPSTELPKPGKKTDLATAIAEAEASIRKSTNSNFEPPAKSSISEFIAKNELPDSPVSTSTSLPWDQQLESTIEAFETQVVTMKLNDYRRKKLQYGLTILRALQERLTGGQIAIEIPQHRDYWQHQMSAILNMLESGQGEDAEHVNVALKHLEGAVQQLKGLAELKIRTLEFCSQVNGYGQFVTMEPTFKSGAKTLVYFEVENFISKSIVIDDQDYFQTRLKSSIEFIDSEKKVVHQMSFPIVEDTGRNRRRDFYMHLPLTFDLETKGELTMKVTIRDVESGKTATSEKRLTLAQ